MRCRARRIRPTTPRRDRPHRARRDRDPPLAGSLRVGRSDGHDRRRRAGLVAGRCGRPAARRSHRADRGGVGLAPAPPAGHAPGRSARSMDPPTGRVRPGRVDGRHRRSGPVPGPRLLAGLGREADRGGRCPRRSEPSPTEPSCSGPSSAISTDLPAALASPVVPACQWWFRPFVRNPESARPSRPFGVTSRRSAPRDRSRSSSSTTGRPTARPGRPVGPGPTS